MDWKKTVEALLAKAARTDSAEEAEACRERASYLMAKFGIEEAHVRMDSGSQEKVEIEVFKMFAPYELRKQSLLVAVCWHLDCMMVYDPANKSCHVFGFRKSLEMVKFLYHSLLAQMNIEIGLAKNPTREHAKTFRNSWLIGFVDGVRVRLQKAKRQATNEVPGTDLVLAKQLDVIENRLREVFQGVKAWRTSEQITSAAGFNQGRAAGERTDIGQTRVGAQSGTRHKLGA